MRGKMTDRVRAIFHYLDNNPALINPDGSYDFTKVWNGLLNAKIYQKRNNVTDAHDTVCGYIDIYLEFKKAWSQPKAT